MASSRLIVSSIKDIIPSQKHIFPELSKLTDHYYHKSRQLLGTLSQFEELERAHICSYIAVNKLKRKLNLPNPSCEMIALPPKKFNKLRIQIENVLLNATPRKTKLSSGIISRPTSPIISSNINTDTTTTLNAVKIPTPSLSPDHNDSQLASPQSKTTSRIISKPKNPNAIVSSNSIEPKMTPSKRIFDDEEVGYGDINGFLEHQKLGQKLANRKGIANLTENLRLLAPSKSNALMSSQTPLKRRKISSLGTPSKYAESNEDNDDNSDNKRKPNIFNSPSGGDIINISSSEPTPIKGRTLRNHIHHNNNNNNTNNQLNASEKNSHLKNRLIEKQNPDLESNTAFSSSSAAVSPINRAKRHQYSPRKSSPLKSELPPTYTPEASQAPSESKKVQTRDIIVMCNALKFPSKITHKVLATFESFKSKIKEEWGFLCGLIMVVFFRIFNDQLNRKIGLRAKFYQKLLKWQRGGLTVDGLKHWNNLTEWMVLDTEGWIKKLEIKFNFNNGKGGADGDLLGKQIKYLYSTADMLNPEVDYLNKFYTVKYDKWISKVKADIMAIE